MILYLNLFLFYFMKKSCRYGVSLAIEIENTKKVVQYSALGALAVGTIGNYINSFILRKIPSY